MGMKGISPLIAVIMLIGLVMIVAGIFASFTQNLALEQIQNVRFCSEAAASIYPSTSFDSLTGDLNLIIYNSGQRDMDFIVFFTYDNGTVVKYGGNVSTSSQDIATESVSGLPSNLYEVTIQSTECPGVQDLWYA
jgi:hypothetical protein